MKKMKVIGLVLVVTMLIGGMSTVAFAADKPADKAAEETGKEESFIDYAKSLGVLSKAELAELEKTEANVAKLKEKVDAIYQKDQLTDADDAKLEKLFNEMDKLYAGIDNIMNKIYEAEGIEKNCSMVDCAKELGVLNETELAKLTDTEKKVNDIQTQIDEINKKTQLSENDEAKINTLYDKIDKLYEGIDDIMNKIYGVDETMEDYSMADYAKELGVLSQDELAKIADTEKKADAIWAKIDKIYEKADLTEADEAKVNALMEEADGLYAAIEGIMQKIYDAEQQKYFDYVKKLGVLSEDEYATFLKTEKKIKELNAKMDELWGDKKELSKEDQAKFETLDKELNKLYESTQPLYDKIFSVEDEPCIVYDEVDAA